MVMLSRKSFVRVLCVFSAAATVALLGFTPQSAMAQSTGDVYVLSNQRDGNAVIVFHRSADGTLTPAHSFFNGGNGAVEGPNPLGSQGAVIWTGN